MSFLVVIEFLNKLYDLLKKLDKKVRAARVKKTIDEGVKSGDQREIEKLLNGKPVRSIPEYRGMFKRLRKKRKRDLDD